MQPAQTRCPQIDARCRAALDLPLSLDASVFTARLRDLEAEVLTCLRDAAEQGFRPGAGASLAGGLTTWRDAAVAAVFARGPADSGMAVLAVGGYGRTELAPASDLDLLIVPGERLDEATSARVAMFQHQLWDLGLAVSASTRTPKQLVTDAREDPHLMTSLFASRPVAGDAGLFRKVRDATSRALRGTRRVFLAQRALDLEAVIGHGGRDVLVKEPNLKTSPGALRSVQLVRWVDVALGYSRAAGSLERARDFFLYLRCLLHFMTGRKEDVLRMEHQHAVARALGMRGDPARMMSRLMRHYYDRAMDVVFAMLDTHDRLHARPSRVHGRRQRGTPTPSPHQTPLSLVQALEAVAALCAAGGKPTGELVERLRVCARSSRDQPTQDRAVFVKFRDLLLLPDSYRALSVLKLSGLLYVYLKPLGRVRHLVVHNPFHLHTVDQHSLEALRVLEALPHLGRSDPERYELPAQVASRYRDGIWVVKLALLMHDVGKAYEGDHSKNGAEMVDDFLRRLPTESLIKDMVVYLTENHLLLSAIARRRVQGDRSAVENLASEIIRSPYPEEALDFLYLITCADATATSERGYTAYQAAGLADLYRETRRLIGEADMQGAGTTSAVEARLAELNRAGHGEGAAVLARALGSRYVGITPPEEIVADWERLGRLQTGGFDFSVSVFNDHLKVKVLAWDRPGLFSVLAGTLLVNGADIVRATIHTYRGVAIDVFVVADVHGNEVLERQMEKELEVWVQDVRASLGRYWQDPEELGRAIVGVERRTRPVQQVFRRETTVRVRRTDGDGLHLELECTDRPALLYDVTRRMAALGLDVTSAAIETTGWYVHDSFEIRLAQAATDGEVERIAREVERAAGPRSGGLGPG